MAGSPSATLVVAIPTVDGREQHLERCEHAYHETTPTGVRLMLVQKRNRATCGEAWNDVAATARLFAMGDTAGPVYFHATADDLEPLPGWYEAAVDVVESGGTPSALIYTARPAQPDVVESHGDWGVRYANRQVTSMSRIPFCRADQWIPIPPIHYFCMPTTHRILTRAQGWATVDEVEVGDLVMAFDAETHEMRWEPLTAINRFPYAGDLMTITRKGDSFQFTPDHRWPVINNMGDPRGFRAGRDLLGAHRLPIRGEFTGAESILDPRLAAILGWVVGDGSYHAKRRQMVVYQSDSQPEKVAEITALLERDPIPSVIGRDVRTWYVWPEDKHAIEAVWRSKADTPRVAAGLSREAAEAMLTALWRAEGSYTSAGGRVIGQSPTANPAVCEAVQILALMTGSNASVPRGSSVSMFLKSSRAMQVAAAMRGTIYYEGDVWCPSTPSGTWIVEHDGAAIPTGNSDNAFSSAMFAQGLPIVADPAFAFRHWWAQEGRHPMNDAQWFAEQTAWQAWATSELLQRAPRWS